MNYYEFKMQIRECELEFNELNFNKLQKLINLLDQQNHYVSEFLIENSKQHITDRKCIEKIRESMISFDSKIHNDMSN